MRKFEVYFPKQAKNIDNCKQLDDETKTTFFNAIDTINSAMDIVSEKQAVRNKAEDYFHSNQFKGQQLTLKDGERLGRLQSWSGLNDYIGKLSNFKDIFDKDKLELYMLKVNTGNLSALEEMLEFLREAPIPSLTNEDLSAMLEFLKEAPLSSLTNEDLSALEKMLEFLRETSIPFLTNGDLSALEEMLEALRKAPIPFLINGGWSALEKMLESLRKVLIPFPFLTWCFRTDTHAPFEGIHLDSLPCRLGLDDLDIQKYFPIEITPPLNIAVKTPTAFDAGLFEHWHPGGKTCHRASCACQHKDGLDEVVIKDGLTYVHVKAPKI